MQTATITRATGLRVANLATLPDRRRPVIVYCANAACPNPGILARRLDQLGYVDVAAYEGGKQDWIEAGLALETPVGV